MDRTELGKKLAVLRSGRQIDSGIISAYSVKSIETGRSSYPVANLFLYADAIGLGIYVWDYNIDEHYRVGAVEDCHELIGYLTAYNGNGHGSIHSTGIRYTKPKNGQALLSIDTLLAILDHFHCLLQFEPA